mmetsp:Transcript_46214/g.148920  ORF Transcript_46214/g.148920 Transcript_46214/m.148920 type:complete len:206 (-) Transcript_46214:799-1416(-)
MPTSSLLSACTSCSASERLKQRGGLMTSTLSCGPSIEVRIRCSSLSREHSQLVSAAAGSRDARSRTNSTPMKRPAPRTSPTTAPCDASSARSACSAARSHCPVAAAFARSPSRSIASRTASPAAAQTGLPPNVLKYSGPAAKASDTRRVATTAASGIPFPIGLPIVTMSGTTPCCSNPHQQVPKRPSPVCTSSATQTPPAARTAS